MDVCRFTFQYRNGTGNGEACLKIKPHRHLTHLQMTNTTENNKRIAKNTLLLYLRMLFLLIINLFTSRIILQTLGIEDYGIYNVVGGVVTMFAFLNNAMAGATQRFLNFNLAENDKNALNSTFNTALIIHIIIASAIVILSETIGLWFLHKKMLIPLERMDAAMWVFQSSIFIMSINIINVPYNATIIAHEKMGAFAYISLFEAILKLTITYFLYISPYDKLKIYAILLLTVSLIIQLIYFSYSNRNFEETHFQWKNWNASKIKEMGIFASWSLIGNLALMGVTQGLNILLNLFFGPTLNAARGIAVQVQSVVQQFAYNFQTAINPQITKSYATNDLLYMHTLICKSAKFSFFMVFILSLPFLIMTEQALTLWLKTPPDYAANFLRIILIVTMIDSLSNPLNNAVNATGRIRNYQLTNGTLMLLVLPAGYLALKINPNPNLVFISQLLITICALSFKLSFTRKYTKLPFSTYINKVLVPITSISVISSILPYIFYENTNRHFCTFILTGILCALSASTTIYILGLDKSEKKVINSKIKLLAKKIYT